MFAFQVGRRVRLTGEMADSFRTDGDTPLVAACVRREGSNGLARSNRYSPRHQAPQIPLTGTAQCLGQSGVGMFPRWSIALAAALLAGAVGVVAVNVHTAGADTITINATADTYVDASRPNSNFGDRPWVSMDAAPARYAFFSFDVQLDPQTTVARAQFRCWAGSNAAAGADLWVADSSWNESSLTWSNASLPDFGSPPIGQIRDSQQGQYVSGDVTPAITGNGPITFVARTTSTTKWSCASNENTGPHPPQLVIQLGAKPTQSSSDNVSPSAPPTTASTTSAPATSSTSQVSTPTSTSAVPTSAPTTTSSAPDTSGSSSGAPPPPPNSGAHKMLVIVEENHGPQSLSQMPHLAGYAAQYGQATNYFALTHPSLPNYLAIWGGSTFGVTSDCSVGSSGCVPSAPSVFGQTLAAGETAQAYQESMGTNCQTGGSSNYAPRHGPWPYWTDSAERQACLSNDVPSGTVSGGNLLDDISKGQLPVTGALTPNLCNDAHDCSVGTADDWLGAWIPKILAGPDFTSGKLTVVITFDEDDNSQNNNVPFVVIDRALHGVSVSGHFNHYSLTRWLDDNAGVAPLRNAAGAPDLRTAFGL
jgi:hypothetical protein